MRKKLDYDYCSASPILEWLGDKWALVVLLKLHENGVIRFNGKHSVNHVANFVN